MALGGSVGAVLRWVADSIAPVSQAPIATLFVNLIGSFLLGAIMATYSLGLTSKESVQLIGVGLLGSFTTVRPHMRSKHWRSGTRLTSLRWRFTCLLRPWAAHLWLWGLEISIRVGITLSPKFRRPEYRRLNVSDVAVLRAINHEVSTGGEKSAIDMPAIGLGV